MSKIDFIVRYKIDFIVMFIIATLAVLTVRFAEPYTLPKWEEPIDMITNSLVVTNIITFDATNSSVIYSMTNGLNTTNWIRQPYIEMNTNTSAWYMQNMLERK